MLGSIFAGIASPTEAASVGCIGALILALANKYFFGRPFNMQTMREVMTSTTKLTCMVFIILVGASAFGLAFRELDGDELVRNFLLGVSEQYSHWTVLIIVMSVIFFVGFVLDFIEITFIHVPVLVPILIEEFHFDPLWICVLLAGQPPDLVHDAAVRFLVVLPESGDATGNPNRPHIPGHHPLCAVPADRPGHRGPVPHAGHLASHRGLRLARIFHAGWAEP